MYDYRIIPSAVNSTLSEIKTLNLENSDNAAEGSISIVEVTISSRGKWDPLDSTARLFKVERDNI